MWRRFDWEWILKHTGRFTNAQVTETEHFTRTCGVYRVYGKVSHQDTLTALYYTKHWKANVRHSRILFAFFLIQGGSGGIISGGGALERPSRSESEVEWDGRVVCSCRTELRGKLGVVLAKLAHFDPLECLRVFSSNEDIFFQRFLSLRYVKNYLYQTSLCL